MVRKQHACHLHQPPHPVHVRGEKRRLVQILANLLNNAAKYTAPGGVIDVRVTVSAAQVEISVEDNGVGMPAALLPDVFDTYTQAAPTPDRAEGGLGLGLALVKELVALHNGTVHAASAGPGRGSTFTLTLPLAGADVPAPASMA
ncbi:histidine kinase/DNA gyrase B/HSP90-like ATPase [Pseudoduganella lurida]|uniref:histidine kinase n=2 Tax=Pseudoduganella lurida TaxID=1036180 RepID=A0A562R0P7_9BURK|nr:histidine kinase/DNA gyrase B/HSP90-like ATPase [Pseudoduganella lurida]